MKRLCMRVFFCFYEKVLMSREDIRENIKINSLLKIYLYLNFIFVYLYDKELDKQKKENLFTLVEYRLMNYYGVSIQWL